MILNTGSRTDIPAYYSDWFYERVRAGEVLVRNPYYPTQITRYRLDPAVVDALVFCTKNPLPMLKRLPLLDAFTMFWFVTITPYGREIEPHVPDKNLIAEAFCRLSESVGRERVSFRYDPIFLNETYTVQHHVENFGELAEKLSGYTGQCVVSFIDLYEKTRRNFPDARSVGKEAQAGLYTTSMPSVTVSTLRSSSSIIPVSYSLIPVVTDATVYPSMIFSLIST